MSLVSSYMSAQQLPKQSRLCAATQKEFQDGDEVCSVAFFEEGRWQRLDYLASQVPESEKDTFSWKFIWRKSERRKPALSGVLGEVLEQFKDWVHNKERSEQEAVLIWAIVFWLDRKKAINWLHKQDEAGGLNVIEVKKTKETFVLPGIEMKRLHDKDVQDALARVWPKPLKVSK